MCLLFVVVVFSFSFLFFIVLLGFFVCFSFLFCCFLLFPSCFPFPLSCSHYHRCKFLSFDLSFLSSFPLGMILMCWVFFVIDFFWGEDDQQKKERVSGERRTSKTGKRGENQGGTEMRCAIAKEKELTPFDYISCETSFFWCDEMWCDATE